MRHAPEAGSSVSRRSVRAGCPAPASAAGTDRWYGTVYRSVLDYLVTAIATGSASYPCRSRNMRSSVDTAVRTVLRCTAGTASATAG